MYLPWLASGALSVFIATDFEEIDESIPTAMRSRLGRSAQVECPGPSRMCSKGNEAGVVIHQARKVLLMLSHHASELETFAYAYSLSEGLSPW